VISFNALSINTSGSVNTANGANSLVFNGSGSYNTAVGCGALYTPGYNNFNGDTGGSSNIAQGCNAGIGFENILVRSAGRMFDAGLARQHFGLEESKCVAPYGARDYESP
jgi:hypothetical protein